MMKQLVPGLWRRLLVDDHRRLRNKLCLLSVTLAFLPAGLEAGPVRFTPDPQRTLQASVYWSFESDGLLLIADRSEVEALPTGNAASPLEDREIVARHHRLAAERGRVMIAQRQDEVVALAASWARRLGAALLFEWPGEEILARCRQIYVLGEVGIPEEPLAADLRVDFFPTLEAIRAAYRQSWGAITDAVLVEPGDPYAPVGVLAAQYHGSILFTDANDAVRAAPTALILALSPERFTDRKILSLSRSLSPRDGFGVLTGVDRLAAQTLWYRGARYRELTALLAPRETVVHAANPAAHVAAGIREAGQPAELPLKKPELRAALRRSLHLSFSGHGSPSYLRLSRQPDERFEATDVPPRIAPVIFFAGSCQILRFWESPERSVALALARAGAVAVIGFAYSPIEGFLPGQYGSSPATAAHPGFPLGRVVRLLNRATERGFARVPFLFLLGDPHLAVEPRGPQLQELTAAERGQRRMLLKRPAGRSGWTAFTIPVERRWGTLVVERQGEVLHRTALSEGRFHKDLVAVARPGAIDVLTRLPAGEVTLRLAPPASLLARMAWQGLGHADYALPFMTGSHGSGGYLLLLAIWMVPLALVTGPRLRHTWRRHSGMLIVYGLFCAGLYLLYCLVRWPHVSVTTKGLEFDFVSVLVPLGAAMASFMTRLTVKRRTRALVLALLAAGLPWLGAGTAMAVAITGGNLLVGQRLGQPLWSLGTAVPFLTTGLVCAGLFVALQAVFLSVKRRGRERSLPEDRLGTMTT